MFGDDQKDAITTKVKEELTDGAQPGENLALWRKTRKDLFTELEEDARLRYEGAAEEYNEKLKQGPPTEHIYR